MMIGMTSGMAASFVACEKAAEARALAFGPDRAEEVAVDHQPDADQKTRHNTAEKKPADRDVASCAVHDRHDARRNEIGHCRGRGDERRSESTVVSLAVHLRPNRAREHRDVGGRRPRNAGKEHAEQRHDLGQPAPQMSDHALRKADHAHGNIRRRHQVADQKEEWNGDERLDIHAVEQLRHHRGVANRRKCCHDQDGGDQRKSHRHAHVAEKEKQRAHHEDEQAVRRHRTSLPRLS